MLVCAVKFSHIEAQLSELLGLACELPSEKEEVYHGYTQSRVNAILLMIHDIHSHIDTVIEITFLHHNHSSSVSCFGRPAN